jgi:hypothetical protein
MRPLTTNSWTADDVALRMTYGLTIHITIYGYQAEGFLTFYVGNLHCDTNTYQVKKALKKSIRIAKLIVSIRCY